MNATLTWVPNGGLNVVNQQVEYRVLSTQSWTLHSTVAPNITTASITGLDNNKIYEFRIVTNCNIGADGYSNIGEKIEITCPVVTVTDVSPTTVQVQFTHLGGSISQYDVDLLNSGNSVVQSQAITNPVGLITVTFSGLSAATNYFIRIKPQATGNLATYHKNDCTTQGATTIPFTTYWAVNTYTCEQDGVFTLANSITGLSSPSVIYYDTTTSMCYVGDHDNPSGNVYKFNPATFTSAGQITVVPGFAKMCYAVSLDRQYKRIYFCGQNTGGLVVFDIATESFSTVPYGSDGPLFNRIDINVVGSRIYVQDRGTGQITIIDRATLSVLGNISIFAVPSGSLYLDTYTMVSVGTEVWVVSRFNGIGDIARYNQSLDTLIGTIALAASPESSGRYRQSCYLDTVNNKLYVGDGGSSKLFVVDTNTRNVVHTKTFTNNQGKLFMLPYFVVDPITTDLFMNLQGYDSAGDPNKTKRVYNVDKQTYAINMMYVSQTFGELTQQGTTNIIWGSDIGLPQWEGGSWSTDGIILKYIR